MFKLGVKMKDKFSGLEGCLTHLQIQGSPDKPIFWYNFQPAKLNPETGLPVDTTWITEERVKDCEEIPLLNHIPLQTLRTKAKDTITGFSGTVTAIIIHINGCVHLSLQPKGSSSKSGSVAQSCDFDIRVLEGPSIPRMTEEEKEISKRKTPSPVKYKRLM